jgi:hypothetical protein
VQKKSFDKVVEGVASFASSLKIGTGFDPRMRSGR